MIYGIRDQHQQPTSFSRRIHITEETHKFLGGDYEVEEGHGGDRHPYLREHNIKSYLVIPPDNFHEVSRFLMAEK